jgi:hypothetical protein
VSVDSVKKIFNEKVNVLNDISSDRSFFLDNERYDKILQEVKEAQILRKNNQPLTLKHYRHFKRYYVMKIDDTEKLVEGDSGENDDSDICYYCKMDKQFLVLETAHVNIGHKRTRGKHTFLCDLQKHSIPLLLNSCSFLSVIEAELKKYCSVTQQVIDLFLTLCELCQLKKRHRNGD